MKKIIISTIVISLLLSTAPHSMGGEEAVEKLDEAVEGLEEVVATHNSVFLEMESGNIVDDPSLTSSYVAEELIVKFRDEAEVSLSSANGILKTNIESVDMLNNEFGVFSAEKIFKNDPTPSLSRVYKFSLSDDADILSIVTEYNSDLNVVYAEPNYIFTIQKAQEKTPSIIPNDPYFDMQWGLNQSNDCDIDAPEAWAVGTGSSNVTVAIIDTGIDYNHSDLAENIWINSGEDLNGNGIVDPSDFNYVDDDDNGFIDDIWGWDFYDDDNNPVDDNGHGTHCSGITSAVTNNSVGVAGVCWNCQIMVIDGFDSQGAGYYDDLALAICYAADNGADVISMSWGGSATSTLLENALDYASSKGVVLVASAGNSNSNSKLYPAGYDNVIAVAATNSNDEKASFSNYGSWIDVAAPGVDIFSTMPTYHVTLNDPPYNCDQNYSYLSGTSMACPHVAGLAGLLLSKTNFSQEEVYTILRSTTDDVTSDKYIGTGRINAYKAIRRNSSPLAILDSSIDDAVVSGNITISGTANGTTFNHYRIYYGEGVYPNTWILLNHSLLPKNDEVLATWNTESVRDGVYIVRLVVTDIYNQKSEDRVVTRVDNVFFTFPPKNKMFGIGEIIEIIGTVTGDAFLNYEIRWGVGENPNEWFLKGINLTNDGQSTVINDTLATWNTSSLTLDSYYTLGLLANFATYNTTETLTIILQNFKLGWPQHTEYRLVAQSVGVGNINGDERLEIVAGDSDWGATYMDMYAWDHKGSDLPGWPKENTATDMCAAPALADIDGDGYNEIFVGTKSGTVEAWYSNGSALPGWPVNDASDFIYSAITVGDIDGDDDLEIIAGSFDKNVYAWHHTGALCSGFPVATGDNVCGSPAVADFDDDGTLEIVVASRDKKVYVWHYNGSLMSGWPISTGESGWGPMSSPAIGDIDDDGDLEIIIFSSKLFAFRHNGTIVTGFPPAHIVGQYDYQSPALGDIDGDGDLEIAVAGETKLENGHLVNTFFVVHHNGTDAEGWPKLPVGKGFGSPLIGDIDGDGDKEILFKNGRTKLQAFHHDGIEVNNWPKLLPAYNGPGWEYYQRSTPIIEDIDKDGYTDLIIGHEDLLVWDLKVMYNKNNIEWGMFQHDSWHTGCYKSPVNNPPNAPTITGPPSGKIGTRYNYTFVSTDPNSHDMESYTIDWGDNNTEVVEGPFDSGEEIIVNHTWTEQGTYTIRAKATDIYGAESDWGTLHVTMPVNQQSIPQQSQQQQIVPQQITLLRGLPSNN